MKIYCLVCKNLTGNNNLKTVKDKKRLMIKSNCSVTVIIKNLDLFHKDLVY